MHTNHRRSSRRHHRLYLHHRRAWLKRLFNHTYRQRVREALRWDPDLWEIPSYDEVCDIWFWD